MSAHNWLCCRCAGCVVSDPARPCVTCMDSAKMDITSWLFTKLFLVQYTFRDPNYDILYKVYFMPRMWSIDKVKEVLALGVR